MTNTQNEIFDPIVICSCGTAMHDYPAQREAHARKCSGTVTAATVEQVTDAGWFTVKVTDGAQFLSLKPVRTREQAESLVKWAKSTGCDAEII